MLFDCLIVKVRQFFNCNKEVFTILYYINKLKNISFNRSDTKAIVLAELKKLLTLSYVGLDPLDFSEDFKNVRIEKDLLLFHVSKKRLLKQINLSSLTYIGKHRGSGLYHGYDMWSVSFEEYNQVYRNEFYMFVNIIVKNVYDKLIDDKSSLYDHVLIEHELTIITLVNTVDYCISHFGHITAEIGDSCTDLLTIFCKDFYIEFNSKNILKDLDNQAVTKSLLDRLSHEKEYLNRRN